MKVKCKMKSDILPTDRSYKVLAIAREVVLSEGCETILPIHILHGLLLEHDGIAGKILTDAGIPVSNQLREEKKSSPDRNNLAAADYENQRMCGIREVPLLSGTAKLVYERATQEGKDLFQKLQHTARPYIGTEHLLLGLLSIPETSAYQYLESKLNENGLKPKHLREAIYDLVGVSGEK